MSRTYSNPSQYLRGGAILRQLETGHAALGDSTKQIGARLKQLEEAGQQNIEQRSKVLLELAKHYLPDLKRDTIQTTFREVRSELEGLLLQKQQHRRELQAKWDGTLDQRQQSQVDLDAVTEELDALVQRREDLEEQLAAILVEDVEFQKLSQQALAAEDELARNVARVNESKQEAADKLPAYEQSRLFQYLIKRGYGTTNYKKRGLTKRWDKWVAKLVKFDRSKKSYDFLRVTPELMAAEVERRRAEFEKLMDAVETIEQHHSDELGLTTVLKEGMKAGKRRDAVLTRMEEDQREQSRLEEEMKQLDSDHSDFYQQAIDRLKHFLGSMHESALDAKARQTVSGEDDKLMDEIRWLNGRLDEARDETGELQPRLSQTRRRQNELVDVIRRFRQAEYDSQRSVFAATFDARPMIQDFVSGNMSRDTLWTTLESHQQFLPNWVERQWEQGGGYPGGGGGRRDGGFLDSDFSYLLMRVLAEAAGAAIRVAADKHINKNRGYGGLSRPGKMPTVRRRGRGGFTGRGGF